MSSAQTGCRLRLPAEMRTVVGRPQGCAMPETGFSIWLGAFCTTQAEAAKSLGITDRSVRRYKEGEREVPKPIAKLMFRMAVEGYRPEMPIQLFHDEWPDCADDARALRDSILEMWS